MVDPSSSATHASLEICDRSVSITRLENNSSTNYPWTRSLAEASSVSTFLLRRLFRPNIGQVPPTMVGVFNFVFFRIPLDVGSDEVILCFLQSPSFTNDIFSIGSGFDMDLSNKLIYSLFR